MLWTITVEVMNSTQLYCYFIIQVKIDENPEVKYNKVRVLYLCFCFSLYAHIWWWYPIFSYSMIVNHFQNSSVS